MSWLRTAMAHPPLLPCAPDLARSNIRIFMFLTSLTPCYFTCQDAATRGLAGCALERCGVAPSATPPSPTVVAASDEHETLRFAPSCSAYGYVFKRLGPILPLPFRGRWRAVSCSRDHWSSSTLISFGGVVLNISNKEPWLRYSVGIVAQAKKRYRVTLVNLVELVEQMNYLTLVWGWVGWQHEAWSNFEGSVCVQPIFSSPFSVRQSSSPNKCLDADDETVTSSYGELSSCAAVRNSYDRRQLCARSELCPEACGEHISYYEIFL